MENQSVRDQDRQLREAIFGQLDADPDLVGRDIAVSAREGVVTLSGTVHSYNTKVLAEQAAKRVIGVRAVANDILVKPEANRSDAEIAHELLHRLQQHSAIPDQNIQVLVNSACVRLEGSVLANDQREAAEECARQIEGVVVVSNRLKVSPDVSPTGVKAKVEEGLRENNDLSGLDIVVQVEEGTVHLYGRVRTWAQLSAAESIAWSAPGVAEVVDHIVIVP